MDSFFSLFDPSDGNQSKQNNKKRHKNDQENVRKNPDAPKGRRRGRRSHGKNETLPEESSFLCEPELSSEVYVKDYSYIENYIEVNRKEDDKTDADKKPRRRNSGRKNRRKKNKISPAKDMAPSNAWQESSTNEDAAHILNNQSNVSKNCDQKIGTNVNDLKTDEDYKKNRRKECTDGRAGGKFADKVYNVIDKLEKVGIKDDMYLVGDFTGEDLESDFLYSSDEMEDYCDDDTTSEGSGSGDECYGSLPPEPRFGNVEYKLQLVAPGERRAQHLATQLKWRLRSGGGSAVYLVGVRDNGALRGLRAPALRASLRSLRAMCAAIGAAIVTVRARRVAPNRAVAEVYIRKMADTQSVELRVAVLGANEAGKSTLIGVLTQGELDNGRGSARLNMFRHLHEVKSGRTSSLSHEILGFDAQGNVVNYGCSELMTAERIGERSAKLVSFLDLAGHSKYQRTTLHGLSGYAPHYAVLVISATAGITRITEEHLSLLLALGIPLCCVFSKCECAPPQTTRALLDRLGRLLAPHAKKPLLITDESQARECVAPQKSLLDTIDKADDVTNNDDEWGVVPVFPVSCVLGAGLSALHAYLLALTPPADPAQPAPGHETCEFQIDEIFHVGDSGGPVVGGLLARGLLCEGDEMIVGPLETGEFVPITVRSIYRNRVPCGSVRAGQSASLGLSHSPPLRQGMALLAVPNKNADSDRSSDKNNKNAKQNNTTKDLNESGAYTTDKLEDKLTDKLSDKLTDKLSDMSDDDKIVLEDPNDPRGCLYFQASVHVLRHATAICPGFQCSVHVGNVRQTAIIEAIMSPNGELRAGEDGSALFRFVRCPEYLVRGRRMLFTAGLGTRAIGRITQTFPHIP